MKKLKRYVLLTLFGPPLMLAYYIGRVLYVVAKLLKSLSYLLMLAPHSAKDELRNIHEVWYESMKDIF